MGTRKFTRSEAGRARSAAHHPSGRSSGRRQSKTVHAASGPALPVEHLRQLTILARRLRGIYGVAITAELALRGQAADQDAEIADCLRIGVCDPINERIREFEALARNLRADPARPLRDS